MLEWCGRRWRRKRGAGGGIRGGEEKGGSGRWNGKDELQEEGMGRVLRKQRDWRNEYEGKVFCCGEEGEEVHRRGGGVGKG